MPRLASRQSFTARLNATGRSWAVKRLKLLEATRKNNGERAGSRVCARSGAAVGPGYDNRPIPASPRLRKYV